ncbi:hypothetical protein IWW55_001776 [Coemansia sp. RSA 2706]|nr:hypothetical protein LPJ63_004969 [Coemansia sp. RSA 2711]KAJ2305752.1 hypothetical protein IWW55_001776 [Coemansia sp. RSA 2706]KAJ2311694.1 hypothetical protein IWW54_002500 [Coemansia sp. RSA 2705]
MITDTQLMSLTNTLGCAVFFLIALFCYVSVNAEGAQAAVAAAAPPTAAKE